VKLWPRKEEVLRCSFCNQSQRDAEKLIAGPNVYICNDCVEICNTILAEDKAAQAVQVSNPPPSPDEGG
jgi:ATP-dependent Clp protease ATP-binding subunit ClpX